MTDAEVETEAKTYDESYVKELRGEAAGYRVERNELKKHVETLADEVKGFKDANKSEFEKAAEKMAEAEKLIADKDLEISEVKLRYEVISESAKLNIVDPDVAFKLLDPSVVEEKGVTKALSLLIKEKPFLLKDSTPSPGAGGSPITRKKSTDEMWVDMMKKGAKK